MDHLFLYSPYSHLHSPPLWLYGIQKRWSTYLSTTSILVLIPLVPLLNKPQKVAKKGKKNMNHLSSVSIHCWMLFFSSSASWKVQKNIFQQNCKCIHEKSFSFPFYSLQGFYALWFLISFPRCCQGNNAICLLWSTTTTAASTQNSRFEFFRVSASSGYNKVNPSCVKNPCIIIIYLFYMQKQKNLSYFRRNTVFFNIHFSHSLFFRFIQTISNSNTHMIAFSTLYTFFPSGYNKMLI